jgi:hypothetical protein
VWAPFGGDNTVIVNGDGYSDIHAENGQTVIVPPTP